MLHPRIDEVGGIIWTGDTEASITAYEGGKILVSRGGEEVMVPLEWAVAVLMAAAADLPKRPVEVSCTVWEYGHTVQEVVTA